MKLNICVQFHFMQCHLYTYSLQTDVIDEKIEPHKFTLKIVSICKHLKHLVKLHCLAQIKSKNYLFNFVIKLFNQNIWSKTQ